MKKDDFVKYHEAVVVVGNDRDFAAIAGDMLRDSDITVTMSENVYSATALIAQKKERDNILVAGTVKELCKEEKRFLGICAEAGISVVNQISRLAEILQPCKTKKVFCKDDYAVSEKELTALLGGQ